MILDDTALSVWTHAKFFPIANRILQRITYGNPKTHKALLKHNERFLVRFIISDKEFTSLIWPLTLCLREQ